MKERNNTTINIAGWKAASCDDGPGIRSVLFFQGCSKHCPGCHNASTHAAGAGKIYELKPLIENIERNCGSHMITISGGEPLEQPAGLIELLKELRQRDFNICLYTGRSREEVPEAVLQYIDYLKVGGFVATLRSGDLQYYGSSNQRMYSVFNGKILAEVA